MVSQALYRKYRSQTFTEVLGQDHIVSTLSAALASGHHVHAYLFTGPRGTGKTTVARLLARALNCTGKPKPCNQCPNCLAAINSSLDVIEIDAASNRSIDAVRDLREKIGLAPTQGQYKVYIIDEVHMLTTEAFNALLKTLEEPPAHAVFILATTEAHKVPETIISRTQRFNFKPIANTTLVQHLANIAKNEKLEIDAGALELIATAARGGVRDAISLLDQLGSGGAKITAATTRDVLGYSDQEEIATLSQALAAGDTRTALETLSRLEAAGAQPAQVVLQLIEQWRAILHLTAGIEAAATPAIRKLAEKLPPAKSARILEALLDISRSPWPSLALEAAVVRLTNAPLATPAPANVAPAPVEAKTAAAPKSKPRPAEEPKATAEAAPTTEAEAANNSLSPSLWPKVLVILKTQNNSLCALLQMYSADFDSDEITIKPRFNFHRDLFLKPANRSLIEAAAARVYGRPVKINAQTISDGAPKNRRRTPDPSAELISSALEILGGEVVD